MENRRTFLGLAAASLLPAGLDAQAPAQKGRGILARHALTGPLEGYDALLVEASRAFGPAPPHRHTGPILGYVLEGQLRFAINQEPAQVVPAGSTFFEPHGALHTTNEAAGPNADARFLVFTVVPKGSGLAG
jgi:hypothetical protein